MRYKIKTHRKDFAAMILLTALAVIVVVYIFGHQLSFTYGKSYYPVKATFQEASAVTAGQGQSVDIAGVEVGQIGGVTLQDGHAVVTMNIYQKYAPIYRNATVLLRPRTPLKDMYLSLDPGTREAGAVPSGGWLGASSTLPDVNFEEILGSLDADTRNYLLLLLAGGAQAFHDPGATGSAPSASAVDSLQGLFKRFAPLNRDTASFSTLLAARSVNLRRVIHNLGLVTGAVGSVDAQLASLIRTSNTNFAAISSQSTALEQALTLLPGTLSQTGQTLGRVRAFAAQSGPTLQALLPFARALSPALRASRPLFRDTTPVIRDQLRPFAVAVQPLARILRPAAASLADGTPRLTRAVGVINALLNTLAYQPQGAKQGYLFWGSWLSHIAASLTNVQDAHGPLVRGIFMAPCGGLNLFEVALAQSDPALIPLLDLLNPPDYKQIKSKYCPLSTPLP